MSWKIIICSLYIIWFIWGSTKWPESNSLSMMNFCFARGWSTMTSIYIGLTLHDARIDIALNVPPEDWPERWPPDYQVQICASCKSMLLTCDHMVDPAAPVWKCEKNNNIWQVNISASTWESAVQSLINPSKNVESIFRESAQLLADYNWQSPELNQQQFYVYKRFSQPHHSWL